MMNTTSKPGAGNEILAKLAALSAQIADMALVQQRMLNANLVLATNKPRPAQGPAQGEVASDAELDHPQYGNPVVRRNPPRWTGADEAGRTMSECSPEFLEELASFNDWRAMKDEEKGEGDKAKWPRLDAARCRGWAARIRGGYVASDTAAPATSAGLHGTADDAEIPF